MKNIPQSEMTRKALEDLKQRAEVYKMTDKPMIKEIKDDLLGESFGIMSVARIGVCASLLIFFCLSALGAGIAVIIYAVRLALGY